MQCPIMLPATLPPPNTKWRQVLPHFEKNQVSYILCLDKIFRQIENKIVLTMWVIVKLKNLGENLKKLSLERQECLTN